jgi:hypothetical protein
MDQQPAVIIHEHEQLGPLRADRPGMGDERADQHVADPDLIRP